VATETWTRVAVPLLEHFANHEVEYSSAPGAIETRAIAEAEGLDPEAAEQELRRLFNAGYFDGKFHLEGLPGDSWMSHPTLTVKGARAARIWPSDKPAEAFLDIIERRLKDAKTPEERGFLQKIKEGFAGVPGSVSASLAVELTKALGGVAF
jgi:hypothetical protein